jgi:hypothetical protein
MSSDFHLFLKSNASGKACLDPRQKFGNTLKFCCLLCFPYSQEYLLIYLYMYVSVYQPTYLPTCLCSIYPFIIHLSKIYPSIIHLLSIYHLYLSIMSISYFYISLSQFLSIYFCLFLSPSCLLTLCVHVLNPELLPPCSVVAYLPLWIVQGLL